jgi:hypothetical protein
LEPIDLLDKKRHKVVKGAPEDRGMAAEPPTAEKSEEQQANEQKERDLHAKLISFYRQELERQADNRYEQALDEDYYDGIQLSEEELEEFKKRGQPPTTYNVLAVSLNWIFGSEKRGRTDDKIYPRGKEDAQAAERKSKYMKYLSDVNRIQFHRSAAFEDAGKVGVGWLECGYQEEDDGEPIFEGSESWRNVLWDSAGSRLSQDDWRYLFRVRFVDEDVAIAMFKHLPGAEEKIKNSVQESSVLGGINMLDGDVAMDFAEAERDTQTSHHMVEFKRRRVRLIQCEYRNPEEVEKLRGGVFNGQIFDENDPRHVEEVESGRATKVKKMMMRMRRAILTPSELIYDAPSIYRHNTFSLTPIWCYCRGRDRMPYGFVRNLRPIQDSINKRASKALQILSSNKVVIEEDALSESMTVEEFADEVARPDAIIPVKQGRIGSIEFNMDRGMDQAHMAQFSTDVGMIERVGGVNRDNLGQQTNAQSGKAIVARQQEGSLATSGPFDNLRLAVQMHGEKKLSLVEQFATEEKQFRITNMRGAPEFVTMNDGLPDNDITRSKADYVVGEAEWRMSMRQAATEQLGQVIQGLPPEVIMSILDLYVESMDIENREEIVKRIRALNGQKDPDQTEPTPEDMAAEQSKAQQQQLQQRDIELGFAEREAKIEKDRAAVRKTDADVDVARSVMFNNNMTGMNSVMSAATQVIQAPTIARVADGIAIQGGWQGGLDVPKNLPQPPSAAQGILMPPPVPPQAAPAPIEAPQQPPMA